MGDRVLQSLLQRCTGQLYNKNVDSNVQGYVENEMMSTLRSVAHYKLTSATPALVRAHDQVEHLPSNEPVVSTSNSVVNDKAGLCGTLFPGHKRRDPPSAT
jgi:hypothetical protein